MCFDESFIGNNTSLQHQSVRNKIENSTMCNTAVNAVKFMDYLLHQHIVISGFYKGLGLFSRIQFYCAIWIEN